MRQHYIGALAVLVLLLASCSTAGSRSPLNAGTAPSSQASPTVTQPTPTISLTSTVLGQATNSAATATARDIELAKVDDAERKWRALNISNYEVSYVYTGAFSFVMNVTVTVQAGRVVIPFKCDSSQASTCDSLMPDTLAIESMFDGARKALRDPHCATTISYHPQYFFPTAINCEGIGITDYQHARRVFDFVPLP